MKNIFGIALLLNLLGCQQDNPPASQPPLITPPTMPKNLHYNAEINKLLVYDDGATAKLCSVENKKDCEPLTTDALGKEILLADQENLLVQTQLGEWRVYHLKTKSGLKLATPTDDVFFTGVCNSNHCVLLNKQGELINFSQSTGEINSKNLLFTDKDLPLEDFESFEFSKNGQVLAGLKKNKLSVVVWNLDLPNTPVTIKATFKKLGDGINDIYYNYINKIAVNEDGSQIATASSSQLVSTQRIDAVTIFWLLDWNEKSVQPIANPKEIYGDFHFLSFAKGLNGINFCLRVASNIIDLTSFGMKEVISFSTLLTYSPESTGKPTLVIKGGKHWIGYLINGEIELSGGN